MTQADIGINNLMALYAENGLTKLVNGRTLKAISHHWQRRIDEYQSILNRYGLKTSRKLGQMYSRWRRQMKSYIDGKVRQVVEWLYSAGVSVIKVGYSTMETSTTSKFGHMDIC